jgi:hypothetical protein
MPSRMAAAFPVPIVRVVPPIRATTDGLPFEGPQALLDGAGCLRERWFAAALTPPKKDRNRGRFVTKSRSLGGNESVKFRSSQCWLFWKRQTLFPAGFASR